MSNTAKTGTRISGIRRQVSGARSEIPDQSSLISWIPRFVISSRLGATALRQGRSARTVRGGRAGQVGPTRLFPAVGPHLFLRRRHIDGVMKPAVPARRHHRRFGNAIIDHPTPLKPECRIDLAVFRSVISIAEFILADELAVAPGP